MDLRLNAGTSLGKLEKLTVFLAAGLFFSRGRATCHNHLASVSLQELTE